ncbi:MAG: DUF308 domain-containing protein [Methanomassiliicoccales archaeon]
MVDGGKNNWMWRMLGGFLLVILGILIIVYPEITVGIVVIVFGVMMLFLGFIQAVFGLSAPEAKSAKWLFILSGILSIIIGILAILTPYYVLIAGWILIAIWAIIWGIFEIVAAFMVPAENMNTIYGDNGKWMAVATGLIAIVLGVIFLAYPESSLTTVVYIAGILVILAGFVQVFESVQMRRVRS